MAQSTSAPGSPAEGTETSEAFADPSRRISDTVQEYGEQGLERTGEAARAVRDTVAEHPIATLAIVAGVAFAIGAFWKIGNSRQQSGYDRLLDRLADLKGQVPPVWR
jgi:ElaB/YqjD/DUF883 family membrane-anchored ribosome-binding protein